MGKFELVTFPNEQSLADAVASRWLKELQSIRPSVPYHVALSGGRITARLFSSIVRESQRLALSVGPVHFFWADERCVPPTHGESNFGVAQQHLFGPLSVAADRIHRIRGEIPERAAVAEAQAEIHRMIPKNGAGQPRFDLIFLGMGEDGHIASLFPDEPEALMSNGAVCRSVVATKVPPVRITLGYAAIAAARQVWVLASGPGKESSLKESLSIGGRTPLGRVIAMRQRTCVFTDIPTRGC